MTKKNKKLGILVGGGPAPGINGVIRSVTIEAINSGLEVYGIYDGFSHLISGDTSHIQRLHIENVSRIHQSGGSILRTSRDSPIKDKKDLSQIKSCLKKLRLDYLVTIGGDGTAYLASQISPFIRLAHVPKTIDNDLPLPKLMPTFGFHTARHYGTEIVESLMEDAKTTSRWYFVVSMGRKAGHLAIGIGKAAGATMTVIAEEFRGKKISFSHLVSILEGAIIKRLASGKSYGVAVLSEGLAEILHEKDLKEITEVEYDVHGQMRLSQLDLGEALQKEVQKSLATKGISMTIVSKDIGYELRSQNPIPFDQEYTQDLGYAAVRFLLSGHRSAIVTIRRGGKTEPLYFKTILDKKGQSIKVRLFDVKSDSYKCARNYMIRLEEKDLTDKKQVSLLSKTAGLSTHDFLKAFKKN